MIVSHRHRFVVLAPWKTASTTIRARLGDYCESRYDTSFHFNTHLRKISTQHLTLAEFLRLPEARLGYRLATFARNPYDRAFSGYLQVCRDLIGMPAWTFPTPWIASTMREASIEQQRMVDAAGGSFDRWIELLSATWEPGAGRDIVPLFPASAWTHVDGVQVPEFVGRVEHFEQDFAAMCDWLGIETPERQTANTSSATPPPQDADGYRYLDRMAGATIERINWMFSADFELLGYRRRVPAVA